MPEGYVAAALGDRAGYARRMKNRDRAEHSPAAWNLLRAGIAAAAVMAVGGLAGCEISDDDIEFVSIAEVRQLQVRAEKSPKDLLLVDPRSVAAYRRAHLPGAINLELRPDMEERGVDPRLASYDQIIVYGDNPGSSAAKAMTKRMMIVGYDDVRLFAGGLEEWQAMQYPVEGDEARK
jgi:3-mercaptopyruvate sulfurtransferase SseA